MLVLSRQIQIIILSRKSSAQETFSCFQLASVHFQFHVAKTNAVAIAALSSQNPGVITNANASLGLIHLLTLMFSPRRSNWERM